MDHPTDSHSRTDSLSREKYLSIYVIVLFFAVAVYLGCIGSPPSLMDDVDSVQGNIARHMLSSGDWVTPRLDGVAFLEKPPLVYWSMAFSFMVFGLRDWAARLPIALSAIALALLTAAFGAWAFGKKAGFYAGLCMSTCVGLFLFTRILLPDVILTLTIALAMWGFLRAIDEEEPNPRLWAFLMAAGLGAGLLLKSLIGVVFPIGAAVIYLALTRQLFSARVWKRLHPFTGTLVILLIAAPWHILATIRNPPWFALTLHSGPNNYHGFLWFFFINEQLLRFLNMRYPRDYNTVPRFLFWTLHFLWLFPWSVYLPAALKLSYKPVDRAGRTRLLAVCWTLFMLGFFTLSTTQEYYSMPCYPALALLIGSAMAMGGQWVKWGTRVLTGIVACAAIACFAIIFLVRGVPTPGDISTALTSNPQAYTLSMGHIEDLTLRSFAYLRMPLAVAGIAFLIGTLGTIRASAQRAFIATALMMVLFFQAAKMALVVFDPYMSSRPMAEAVRRDPPGTLIVDHHYYWFSSVLFYLNSECLLLNGRHTNLEYGANAPDAPDVFIDDPGFKVRWLTPDRYYIFTKQEDVPRLSALVGMDQLNLVVASGGKIVLTNHPLASTIPLTSIKN